MTQIFIFIFSVLILPHVAVAFPVMPELQAYHTLGIQGSSYSTGAVGLSIDLNKQPDGGNRTLNLLVLNIPTMMAELRTKVGGWYLDQEGRGAEIGLQDYWKNKDKGATLAYRYLEWPRVRKGASIQGDAVSHILHLGWSAGKMAFITTFGLDFASTHLPDTFFIEPQLAIGLKSQF
ncbi:hypothetical protein WDW89_11700 [Deltaproteobacteria bacterium TL4]